MVWAAILVFIAAPSFAWEDAIASWSSVTIRTPKSEGSLTVSASANAGKLGALSLLVDGANIEVPLSELRDLEAVQLNSIEVLYGVFPEISGKSNVPYQYVRVKFGKPNKRGEFPWADFMFYSGAYQERRTRRLAAKNAWAIENKKPGKPVEREGTEERLQ